MEEDRSAFKILTCKPEVNIPSERSMRRRENNIEMDLKKIGINTRD